MRGEPKSKVTPMFKQYFKIKEQYPDAVLFFRLGDFYEMFFEDAETVAPLLGLVLTKRDAGKGLTAPMCGVPAEKSSFYIQKLVEMGFKVAICEQVEDPSTAKGLVRREVVKIYTPGLAVDLETFSDREKKYLASIFVEKNAGIAFLELSCGEFVFTEVKKELLLSELLKKEPKEVLLDKKHENSELAKAIKQNLPRVHLSFVEKDFFSKDVFEGYEENLKILERHGERFKEGLKATAGILRYVELYQPHLSDKLSPPEFYFPEEFLFLDESTKRNLELLRNLWDGSEKYSLFWVLDSTVTPMGARLLKEWIVYPLQDIEKIHKRLETVEFFVENWELREELRKVLRKISDLERLSVKCSLRLAKPKELATLRGALRVLPEVKALLEKTKSLRQPELLKEIAEGIEPFSEVLEVLENTLVDEPPNTLKEGGIIKRGVNEELDELRDIKEHAMDYLENLEKKEREKTKIPTLKIKFNKVFGYYFEVSKSYLHLVPEYFERKQTLANAERYFTAELKELETKILNAEERIKELEYQLFLKLREEVAGFGEALKGTARRLAELDVLLSLAEVAVKNDYTKPEVVKEQVLKVKEGRHPVIEKIQGRENFVPNSVELDKERALLLVITGPNMGGKSTFLRQNALIVIMAQMGSFVPAEEAKIGVFDRIFSRIGAGDELVRGKSTFMVEMSECAYILKNASPRSLVILDEVGRGTSTYDGMSLAWAIAEELYEKEVFTLLATHYFELTELASIYPKIKNYHVEVKEWEDEVIFLYRVKKGAASQSYGIEVAKLAGIPKKVVDRAREILYKLEGKRLRGPVEVGLKSKAKAAQLSIFEAEHPVVKKIKELNIEEMTPISALNFLWELKQNLCSEKKR